MVNLSHTSSNHVFDMMTVNLYMKEKLNDELNVRFDSKNLEILKSM